MGALIIPELEEVEKIAVTDDADVGAFVLDRKSQKTESETVDVDWLFDILMI